MLLIQVLVVLFAVFACTRALGRFHAGAIGLAELVGWTLFWLAAGMAAVVPAITQWFADLLGVGRGADAVFYTALVALFYLGFRAQLRVRSLEQQLTQLVRRLALEEAKRDGR